MSLFEEIDGILEKEGISGKEFVDVYKTGINIFDWRNAQYDDTLQNYVNGISAGTLNSIIGKSGSAKTTFAIQSATHIADMFDNGNIIHFDFEQSSNVNRVMSLSGWDRDKFRKKYRFLNSGITVEGLYKVCKATSKIKQEKRKELEYDTGAVDKDGNPIMELPPTIVIIDSIATMYSDSNVEEEETSGQMSTTAQAKANNQMIKRLSGSSTLTDGNIIILAINHITTKIDINAFAKTPADINYLKQDEALVGKQYCSL